jgi:CRP-like cAMP-binding protein
MSDRGLAHYLRHMRLFRGIPDEILEKVANQIKVLELQKNDVLVKAGDISNSMYIIRTGWVKITTEGHTGQEVMLNQCGPGQVIGEMSLIDQQNRSNTVIALCPTTVLEIDYTIVMNILNDYPAMAQTFLRDMSNRVRFANAYIGEAIEWCQQIAEGNYDFVKNQVNETQATIIDMNKSPQARAGAFLSAFFKMVEASASAKSSTNARFRNSPFKSMRSNGRNRWPKSPNRNSLKIYRPRPAPCAPGGRPKQTSGTPMPLNCG